LSDASAAGTEVSPIPEVRRIDEAITSVEADLVKLFAAVHVDARVVARATLNGENPVYDVAAPLARISSLQTLVAALNELRIIAAYRGLERIAAKAEGDVADATATIEQIEGSLKAVDFSGLDLGETARAEGTVAIAEVRLKQLVEARRSLVNQAVVNRDARAHMRLVHEELFAAEGVE